MSAWYILSALGFYPVSLRIPNYDFGTPLFKEAKINLENGKTFTIKAANVSDKNIYIKSVKLNGKPVKQTFFPHKDLITGGTFEFEMSDTPVKNWFTEFSSSRIETNFSPVPSVEAQRSFEKETLVKISTPVENAKIFYTLDGSEPDENSNLYKEPLTIAETAIVKAISVSANGEKSFIAESQLNKMPNDWEVKLVINV